MITMIVSAHYLSVSPDQLTFFSIPLKNWNMVMLAGGLDMPSAMQMPFSSWNTGLPDSWAFFWGLLTRIILDASNSDTKKAKTEIEFG